jgi:hypothetical protein
MARELSDLVSNREDAMRHWRLPIDASPATPSV